MSIKKERVRTVLKGKTPDRIPVSTWGHDFLREWSAEELASHTIERQRAFDYDFVKLNPRWTFFGELYGNRYEPAQEQRHPLLVHKVIESAEDFSKVGILDNTNPIFAEHLEALKMVVDEIGDEVDILYTVFSPLAVAGLLCGGIGEPFTTMAKENPDIIHPALQAITDSLKDHVGDVLSQGASGLFFASLQWTSTDICDPKFYQEFGRPYDQAVLDAVQGADFNMFHVCGNHIEMDRFMDYPVEIFNWDNFGPGNPTLAEIHQETDRIVSGGVPHRQIHKMNFDEIRKAAETSVKGIDNRVMLTGGCGVSALLDSERRRFVRDLADSLG